MKFIIISILLSISCFSQVNDSLVTEIKHLENDTEQVNQFYKIGFDIRNTDPLAAYSYALICNETALKSKSLKHIAKSYNLLGILYYKKGDYTQALNFQNKALNLNQIIHNELGIAINYTNLGNIYNETHNLNKAEFYYLSALKSYNNVNNTLQITRSLINIGVLKYNQKQFEAAIKLFENALTYATTLNDYELTATCYNNIGSILTEQNKLDSALFYLEEGLKFRILIDDEFELADSYNNLALFYIKQSKYDKANHFIELANTICTKYFYTETLIELYKTRSLLCEAQNDFKASIFWIKKHYNLKDSIALLANENQTLNFVENQLHTKQLKNDSSNINNTWLLISILILLVIIPVFLIKNKR